MLNHRTGQAGPGDVQLQPRFLSGYEISQLQTPRATTQAKTLSFQGAKGMITRHFVLRSI